MAHSVTPVDAAHGATAGRGWFALNAVVAWFGLTAQFVLSATGVYPTSQTVLSQLGPGNPSGVAGALPRVIDFFSYFTIWSNIVVALVLTVLAATPTRDTPTLRVLRLDALLMITITGIVYAVVLAPTAQLRGWEVLPNTFNHILTPIVTVVVWLIAGPRGWIRWSTIAQAMLLPLVWLGYTLVRGVVIEAYPYPFIDVVRLGYGQVAINVMAIVVFALALGSIFLGIDRLLSRRTG